MQLRANSDILSPFSHFSLYPFWIANALLYYGKELAEPLLTQMYDCAKQIASQLEAFGEKAAAFAEHFVSAVQTLVSYIAEAFQRNFNAAYAAAVNHPQITVNTVKLRAYAERFRNVNRRLDTLDKQMDDLYWKVGLRDLFNLLQADLLTGTNRRISNCARYLEETATDFDTTERNVAALF